MLLSNDIRPFLSAYWKFRAFRHQTSHIPLCDKMASTSNPPETSNFSAEQFRTYALFRFLLGRETPEIHRDLVAIGGPAAPSERTLRRWVEGFRSGRHTVEDLPRSGRPVSAITNEIIHNVEQAVVEDAHITTEEVAEECGISAGTVHTILHERLRMRKISSRWVPHLLSTAQQAERVELAQSLLNKMRRWGAEGIRRIVTGDETYIYYHEPGSRSERMAWTRQGEPPPTEVRRSTFTGKVLYTFVFSADGLVAKMLSPAGSTVTATCYAATVLPAVLASFQSAHPNQMMRLHHDNAAPHRAKLVSHFLSENGIQCIRHPPYSPDLAPCDCWLFPIWKCKLRGRSFTSRNSLGQAVSQAIADIQQNEWSNAFEEWKRRCQKCVENGGIYFEHLP
jgi:[histone H3]-lysine36 N-dimethyltransferase SETMAR